MHKLRIYIDTSVIGGCFDEEFAEWSNKLFQEFIDGKKIAVVSEITIRELENAPDYVKKKLFSINKDFIENLEILDDVDNLVESYLKNKAISNKFIEDAYHIAYATVYNIDVLVSWNFKHIVNLDRIKKYNAINLLNGYKIIEIRTPKEVVSSDDENI